MTLTTYADRRPTGPSATGPPTPRSRSPAGSTPPSRWRPSTPATTVIGGVAWAQQPAASRKVEVRIDGGAWQDAKLGPTPATTTGASGSSRWDAEPGPAQPRRAAPSTGTATSQTAARAAPFPRAPAASRRSSSTSPDRLGRSAPTSAPLTGQSASAAAPNDSDRSPLAASTEGTLTMNRTTLRRTGASPPLALTLLALGLAACGERRRDSGSTAEPRRRHPVRQASRIAERVRWPPTPAPSTFGPGCAAIPTARRRLLQRHGHRTRSPPPRAPTRC